MSRLRPGDVIVVPAARRRGLAVVLDWRDGRPTVFAQDRKMFRLRTDLFTDPPQAVAKVLFQSYFFPFEATSILLIVAAIAAMVMAQRKAPAVTQAEAEAARSSVAGPAGREATA